MLRTVQIIQIKCFFGKLLLFAKEPHIRRINGLKGLIASIIMHVLAYSFSIKVMVEIYSKTYLDPQTNVQLFGSLADIS
jgi:hypothetical protein